MKDCALKEDKYNSGHVAIVAPRAVLRPALEATRFGLGGHVGRK